MDQGIFFYSMTCLLLCKCISTFSSCYRVYLPCPGEQMVSLIRDCDECDASMRKSVAQVCELLPRLSLIHTATPLQLGALAAFADIK